MSGRACNDLLQDRMNIRSAEGDFYTLDIQIDGIAGGVRARGRLFEVVVRRCFG